MSSRLRVKRRAVLLRQQAQLMGMTPVQLAKYLFTFALEEGDVKATIMDNLLMSAATYRWEQ